jgi:hypothetical protein
MKWLRRNRQGIAVAPSREERVRFDCGKSGHDPVDECVKEEVAPFDPGRECRPEIPSRDMGENDSPESRAVRFDQLAGKKNEPRCLGAAERVVSRLQKSRRLRGKGYGADCRIIGLGDVNDSSFCGVGDDEAEVRRLGDSERIRPATVRVERALDRANHAAIFHLAAGRVAAQQHRVEVVLRRQRRRLAPGTRQKNGDASVEHAPVVGDIDHPVDRAAKKHAVANLKNADGSRA